MNLTDLDYDLPPRLIAQHPTPERDASRLLAVRRGGAVLGHHHFHDLPTFLNSGDLLVLNDTRVLPARLVGHRTRTSGKWEGLFLRDLGEGTWELLCQTRGRLLTGETILVETESDVEGEPLRIRLVEKTAAGHWLARPESEQSSTALLEQFGRVPLPPYIRKGRANASDRDRYQTVYAERGGAVAAPTAGLHFTPRVFEALDQRGIGRTFVTLHVGAGTFQPVQSEDVTEHRVQAEWGEISVPSAEAIAACKGRGNKVIAVGTTSARILETAALNAGLGKPWSGWTELTICPPFTFQAVDALVTNFHLPRSSLLLLVAAFTGLDSLRTAYAQAIEHEYRFYSYGDAMIIL